MPEPRLRGADFERASDCRAGMPVLQRVRGADRGAGYEVRQADARSCVARGCRAEANQRVCVSARRIIGARAARCRRSAAPQQSAASGGAVVTRELLLRSGCCNADEVALLWWLWLFLAFACFVF